nr:PQQ-binding-like beta-propeller repeat protein [Pedobacter panaciterrae]
MKNKNAHKYLVFGMLFFVMLLFSCKKDKLKEPELAELKLKDRVYIGSSDNNFYALNATNGNLIWKYTAKDFSYSDPIVVGETVYAGSIDGNMYAFDAINGSVKWKFFTSAVGIESSPAVSDGIIYFGSNNGSFYALNATTGELKWKMETSQNVSSSPVVANNIVYFGSSNGIMYAAGAKTGDLIWSYQTGGMINQSSPALSNGVIFIGSRDGHLYALNANNGSLKWKYSTKGISLEQSSPVVDSGTVYVGGWYDVNDFSVAGSLLALDEVTGILKWESLKGVGVGGSPSVLNGLLYVSADDGYFYTFNALTGVELWSKNILPNGAGAAGADGLVFVGAGGHKDIYAYDARTGDVKWRNSDISGISTSTPCLVDSRGVIVHR